MSSEEKHENRENQHEKQLQVRVEHPPSLYSIGEMYMIKKESVYHSNDHIYKKLGRCFQRIKKMKNANRDRELNMEYDTDNSKIRKDFRRIRDLYNNSSKSPMITKHKIEKMKKRVEKVKSEVQKDQLYLSRQVQIMKLYNKSYNSKSNGQTQNDKK